MPPWLLPLAMCVIVVVVVNVVFLLMLAHDWGDNDEDY